MSSLASPLARSLTAAPVGVPWARITAAPGATITNIVDDAAALIFGFRLWAVLAWKTVGAAGSCVTDQLGLLRLLRLGAGANTVSPDGIYWGGGSGACFDDVLVLSPGTRAVTIGAPNVHAGATSFGELRAPGGHQFGGVGMSGAGFFPWARQGGGAGGPGTSDSAPGVGVWSNITGVLLEYGKGGGETGVPRANMGDGGSKTSGSGSAGSVIARVPAHLAPPLWLSAFVVSLLLAALFVAVAHV